MSNLRETVKEFLATQRYCVISTVSQTGTSESALVAFSESPSMQIAIGTSMHSRKFKNIEMNNRVSLVIGFDQQSLQLEGTVRIAVGAEIEACITQHLAKFPTAAKYVNDPAERFIVITPTWMRFVDYSTGENVIIEESF